MSIMKSAISAALVIACQQITPPKDTPATHGPSTVERVIVFAVQQESEASHLRSRKDLCIGFGHGLAVDEKAIISQLKHNGLKVHPNQWCNRGPRGLRIGIVAPINEVAPGMYELVIELGDLSIRQGEHFATLLRRGTYVIRCDNGARPQLVSYRQTCCAKTS